MGACDCVLTFHLAGENIGRLDTNLNTDGQDRQNQIKRLQL